MSLISSGKAFDLLTLVVIWGSAAYALYLLKKGTVKTIKTMPAIGGITEAINRAVETGRKIVFLHEGNLASRDTLPTMACLTFASYVAEQVAKVSGDLIVSITKTSEVIPIMTENIKTGLTAGGAPELWTPDMLRFFPKPAYTIENVGLIETERPGALFHFGRWAHSGIINSTIGRVVGAMQVGGTNLLGSTSYFAANCDYVFIGEEYFAAAAKLSGNPQALNSIYGGDLSKTFLIAVLLILILTISFGFMGFLDLVVM